MKYCHLHVHSHLSLLDGVSKIDELVTRTKEHGVDSLALTDHGCVFGLIKFYKECRRQGINPILGTEAYIVNDRRLKDDSNFHLTLLAKNRAGYQNLIRLASAAFLEGFYRKPRIDYDLLSIHREGLIVLSGCMSSQFAQLVGDKAEQDTLAYVHRMQSIFPDFFIEIQRNGMPAQEEITKATIDFSTRKGLPMVATADTHYVNKEDAEVQDILLCVNTGSKIWHRDRMKMDGNQYYLKSPEEMYEQFCDQQESVRRSSEIADKVDIQLDLGARHFPVFDCGGEKPKDTLRRLSFVGLERLGDNIQRGGYEERLNQELGVIDELGYNEYFLIVYDFVKWGRERGIMSSARGSGVGCLVCYCLYISHVDPVEHGLLFERFLSKSRREAPDIDVDVEKDRRGEVMQYIRDKYGEDHVAHIGTFGTMGPKSAIKDVARVLGYPLEKTIEITELIPDNPFHEFKDSIENRDFKQIYEHDEDARKVIDYALRLQGTARSLGTHAAGVVVFDKPLTEYVPLAKGRSGEVITQFDMHDCEEVGAIKLDLLGLRTLSILSECVDVIEDAHGARIDLDRIPMDDFKTYNLLGAGDTKGVFQAESPGITEVFRRFKPDCLGHIAMIIAAYRPAQIDSGILESFIRRRRGEEEIPRVHPVVDSILEDTLGHPIFQELIMKLANEVGLIPMDACYSLIKSISKKIPEKVAEYRDRFYSGCNKSGLSEDATDHIWSVIQAASRYGFNASHAYAYARVTYQTVYLKANYPAEFMTALLNSDIPERNFASAKDKLTEHLEDCRRMGIVVHPPDINRGGASFRVQEGEILFGLAAVKGVKPEHALSIENNRSTQYEGLIDFYSRNSKADVPQATIRNLIRVGACDSWPRSREQNELAIDKVVKYTAGGYKRPPAEDKLFESKKKLDDSKLELEKQYLGYYLSGHPSDDIAELISNYSTAWPETIHLIPPKRFVYAGGMVTRLRRGYTKHEKPYLAFALETKGGAIDCVAWSGVCVKCHWVDNGDLVFVRGRIDTRGTNRSLTVKKLLPPDAIDWSVIYVVGDTDLKSLLRIAKPYSPGKRELWWRAMRWTFCVGTVNSCPELVTDLQSHGGKVEVCAS